MDARSPTSRRAFALLSQTMQQRSRNYGGVGCQAAVSNAPEMRTLTALAMPEGSNVQMYISPVFICRRLMLLLRKIWRLKGWLVYHTFLLLKAWETNKQKAIVDRKTKDC